MLVRSGGARHVVVAVNKMDECEWAESRFTEIQSKLNPFLKSLGFNLDADVSWIPIAGLEGSNLKQVVDPAVCPWYKGPSLLELLDSVDLPRRYLDKALRIPVSSAYRDGEVFVMGKIESGRVAVGQDLVLMPKGLSAKVLQVLIDNEALDKAGAGDIVRLKVGAAKGIGEDDFAPGCVLCAAQEETCKPVTRFKVRLNVLETQKLLTAGYSCMLHVHSVASLCSWEKVIQVLDKKTGSAKKVPFVRVGQTCDLEIEVPEAICVETYKDFPQLGRFVLREDGATVGIGVITSLGC